MNLLDMRKGIFYKVVKGNDTCHVGDRVHFLDDGDLFNEQAKGWIKKGDISLAADGVEVELDKEHYIEMKCILEVKLDEIKKMLGE